MYGQVQDPILTNSKKYLLTYGKLETKKLIMHKNAFSVQKLAYKPHLRSKSAPCEIKEAGTVTWYSTSG